MLAKEGWQEVCLPQEEDSLWQEEGSLWRQDLQSHDDWLPQNRLSDSYDPILII
jgi:hypothetical protein